MIRLLLVIIFVVLYLLIGIPILGITWLIGRANRHAQDIICLRLVQVAFKIILFLSGTNVTVKGAENVPKDQAVLYIGNHRSYFDILLTYSRCPGLTGYVSKDVLNKVPLLNLWMKRLYCLFLDRSDMKKGLQMILTGIDQIKHGISMCIFPEGTRNTTEETLLPFKEGSMKMAEKTGCLIIPMAITNSANIMENHMPWIKAAHVTLQYGKPIDPKDLTKEQKKFLGAYTREIILDMLDQERESAQ